MTASSRVETPGSVRLLLQSLAGDDCCDSSTHDSSSRRSFLTATVSLFPFCTATCARADDDSLSQAIRKSLKSPTEDQPQIFFPELSQQPQNPTLEGLLYLENPQSSRRPSPSDIVVITARLWEQGDGQTLIGGAKLPVARITFPVRFSLTQANSVVDPPLWRDALQTRDSIVVEAIVCDRDVVSTTSVDALVQACRESTENPPLQASGVAKLLKIQSNNEPTISTVIRAPVSLPLG